MTKDPYRFFRIEARELVESLARGLLEVERTEDTASIKSLLRFAHTLKGAARVVKQSEIAERAHEIEDALAPSREGRFAPRPEEVDRMLASIDRIRELLLAIDAPPLSSSDPPLPQEQLRYARIPMTELDALLASIMEASTAAAQVARHPKEVQRTEALQAYLLRLFERVVEMRLVAAQELVGDLERAARDAARALDKEVQFFAAGTSTRIDADVLASLRGALVHLIQNAVAHGIEARGRVGLEIERRGHRVAFIVTDDGRGFDVAAIRRLSIERGLVSADRATSMETRQVIDLLFRGGLSTSRTVTKIAGRGVGLDVVRAAMEHLNGEIAVSSSRAGTKIELLVPTSLSSMPALEVIAAGSTALLPLDAVRRAVRVRSEEVSGVSKEAQLTVGEETFPLISLGRALGKSARTASQMRTAVVVDASEKRVAIEVDRIGAIRNVLVRKLPQHVVSSPIVLGAVLADEGAPQLMLAPAALVHLGAETSVPIDPPERPPLPLLVVDDSLTTRMLEKSILESQGYRVHLAVSGEDGLEKARTNAYALFIVDVEMPGIDGFEFVARTKQDPELADIPSILVTSRADPEDKRRGKEAGARAYLVKSEFDQRTLLDTIRRLIES